MRKRLLAAAMSFSLAAVTVLPGAVWAEEESSIEETANEDEYEEYDYSAGYEDNGFFIGIRALDYVTLPVYTGVVLPGTEVIPSEEEIQRQIDSMLYTFATDEQITDRAVEDGDTVNIDYVGSIDGVEFAGGSTGGYGTDVTIGVTQYIDDFLEQLIGHEPGETIDVEVTFPDYYPQNTDLENKDAVFVTTINYIVGELQYPELTDEFVSENVGFDTVDEYRQDIYDTLYSNNLTDALLSYLVDNAEVSEIPESVVDTVFDYEFEYFGSYAAYFGMDAEEYLAAIGMTVDDLRAECETYGGELLVLQAVMEDASLEISKEYAAEVIGVDEETYDMYVEFYGLGFVNNTVIQDCVADFMRQSATVDESETEDGEETETQEETETEEETETAEE